MGRIGLALSGGLAPEEIVECVRLADQLGYDSFWMAEGHGGDQFAILAACALVTRRIRLATGISSVFVRSAPTIAMAAATVDRLSGGRFVLGLGSSHRVQVEGEHGLAYDRPVDRLRETVQVVRRLLRDGHVEFAGETIAIRRFDLWFTPGRPEIPIYLAALFGPMLEVCGELAQGALLTWSSLSAGSRAARHVAAGAARAGRAPEGVDIASFLPCVVADTPQEARDRLRASVAFYAGFFPRYNRLFAESGFPDAARSVRAAWDRGDRTEAARRVPDALVDAVAIAGPPDLCRDRVERYRASGIALPIIAPRVSAGEGHAAVLAAIRACAP